MAENAFNDECTGGNPVYPLISEMRDVYLRAYWGKEYEAKKASFPAPKVEMWSNPFGKDYEVQLNGVELPTAEAPKAKKAAAKK